MFYLLLRQFHVFGLSRAVAHHFMPDCSYEVHRRCMSFIIFRLYLCVAFRSQNQASCNGRLPDKSFPMDRETNTRS